uniref:Uncharacterized protein n=1 Tax=Clytia hemisphaerica TaxID=252671 RepID=A0A7M5V685_9CNID
MAWYFTLQASLPILVLLLNDWIIAVDGFECRKYSHGQFDQRNHVCKDNPFLTSICHVTKRNGIAESGCLMEGSKSECNTRYERKGDTYAVCCCETDQCNDRKFIEKCASTGRSVKSCGVIIVILTLFGALFSF